MKNSSTNTPALPAKPTRRRSALAAKLLLLAITGTLCLGALEFLVRTFLPYCNPNTQIPFFMSDEGVVLGQRSTTSRQRTPKGDFDITVSFNRHGFRDAKDYTQAASNDVFVVGDSFSIGWGVEEKERFSNLLEQKLTKPIFNIAIPEDIRGYARTIQYVERHGAHPQHIILGLCMENDLWDYDSVASTHELYQRQMVRTFRHRAAVWIKGHSAIWIACSQVIQRQAGLRRFFEKIGIARNIDELTHKNESSPQILDSSRRELLKLLANRHAVLLIVPSRGLWYGKNIAVEQTVHDQFVQSLRDARVPLVDMRPIFEQTGDPLAFYFRNDPHWNPRGHAAAAEALARYFAQTEDWSFLRSPTPARP